ncbi:MAG: hypothetical protein Q9182_001349 [Xanthomendoza sp. 2 TL-2023]
MMVNGLFTSYDSVLKQTTPDLGDIITAFNDNKLPEGDNALSVQVLDRLLAYPLSLGLNVIAATQTATGRKTRDIARIWTDSLLAAPNVARAIWPAGDLNQQQLNLNDRTLATRSNIDAQLSRGLQLLMSDLDTFLAFAANGRFTTANIPTVPSSEPAADLTLGRNTFLTSKLMERAGFYAIPGPIVVDEPTFLAKNPSCRDATATNTICAAAANTFVYRSPTTHRTYELKNKATPQMQMQISALVEHLNDGAWADREVLFDGNFNCTSGGQAGREIVGGKVDVVGCLSQLPMYLDCGGECPAGAVLVGGKCPFGRWRKC